jgi:hypothetical protein
MVLCKSYYLVVEEKGAEDNKTWKRTGNGEVDVALASQASSSSHGAYHTTCLTHHGARIDMPDAPSCPWLNQYQHSSHQTTTVSARFIMNGSRLARGLVVAYD